MNSGTILAATVKKDVGDVGSILWQGDDVVIPATAALAAQRLPHAHCTDVR